MKALILMLLTLSFLSLSANYVRNQPLTLDQPDGSVYEALVTGDEFNRRMHDADGYTIVQNPRTGFYVYAVADGNSLRESDYVAGKVNPAGLGISPNLRLDPQLVRDRVAAHQEALGTADSRAPSTGTINNIFIFCRFNDQSEFTTPISTYDTMCNSTTAASMRGYFLQESNNQLTINTTFYPAAVGGIVRSYQSTQDRGYFLPWSASNPIGYTTDTIGYQRLQTMMRAAIVSVSGSIPAGLNVDGDGDGNVDNVTFVIQGSTSGIWASPLWPHHWTLHLVTAVYINTKRVWDYNAQFSSTIGTGVICHEMSHSMGFPDLYHYDEDYDHLAPVGSWDLMEWDASPPQHHLTHMKKKYGGWFSTVPTITPSSTPTVYTLTAIDQNPFSCYKIASTNPNQYYMLEYRRKTGLYENSIPGSGLLVSRIITQHDGTTLNGNADGPPDEVYLYRPGGTVTVNGTINSANFSSNVSRTKIHTGANPEPWLYINAVTQTDGPLVITDIGASGGTTISFTVRDRVPNIWDGSSSTAWATAANWSLNHVPTADEDVEIPSLLTRYPVVSTNQSCRSIMVQSGASLTIGGADLSITNDLNMFGTLTMNDSAGDLWVGRDLFFQSGSTANISANAYIHVQSDIEFLAGSDIEITNGSIWFYGTGQSYIRNYTPTTLYHLRSDKDSPYVSGISAVSTAALTINGGLYVYSGSTMTHPSSYSLIIKGSFYCYAGGLCTFNSGTVSMEGITNNYISLADAGNYLNNLTIAKGGANYVYLSNPLTVDNNLTINSGILHSNSHAISVGGNWDNNAGVANFIEGTGTVTLDGSGTQTVSTETFNILVLDKDGGSMSIPAGSTVSCASYDWNSGAYAVSGGEFIVADLADPGIFGTITLSSGTIDYTQGTDQYVDLRCNLTITGGTFNVNGGSSVCWFSYIDVASLTMNNGILDIRNQSIRIPSGYVFNEAISGGTIRTVGSLYVERPDFNPTGGTIEFYGSANCTWQNTSGSNVYRVYINKSATREGNDLPQVYDPRSRDPQEPLLRLNQVTGSGSLDINGNLVINTGTFVAPATINIAGGWYNYVGPDAFVEGAGAVTFDGSGHQYCNYTENFNLILISKSGGALRVNSAAAVVTCAGYDWAAGAVDVLVGTFTANDLVQNGIYGNFYNNTGGTINLHQDTGQYIDLNGFFYNYGGTINIYGGMMSSYWAYYANAGITMTDGVIDFKDKGITIVSRPYILAIDVTGGTIRTVSWYSDTRGGVVLAGGVVELYGPLAASVTLGAGSSFHDLKINKASTRNADPDTAPTAWMPNNNHEPELGTDYRLNDVVVNSDLIVTNDLTIQAGILTNSAGNFNITLGGNWINSVGTTGFVPGTGTVFLNGSADSQYIYGSNIFHNVTDILSDQIVYFQNASTVGGTLTINDGVIVQHPNNFNTVIHTVPTASLLFNGNFTSTIGSYTGGGILSTIYSHHVIINDLTQNGLYGAFLADAGHLEFHQDSSNWIDLNGDMTITNNGTVDIYGGNMDCYIAYNGDCVFTLSSGSFNVKDRGFYIYDHGYTCDFVVSGGTITANGSWHDLWGIFDPTGGSVVLTGSGNNTLDPHASSWFWNLKINKVATRETGREEPLFETDRDGIEHLVTRTCDLHIYAPSTLKGGLDIQAANTIYLHGAMNSTNSGSITVANASLRLNGHNLTSTGNIAINSGGVLQVDPASSLLMNGSRTINVNDGGSLLVSGNSTTAATVTHNTTGYYGLSVNSGGTLGGYYGIFEYMNASGVVLNPGSLVDTIIPFDFCTFRLGASGGRLLAINNGQSFTVNGASFPTNTWGGAYNVSKTVDAGIVYFDDWSGAFGGPAFEQDSYNHVYWEGYGIPPITDLSIQYIPSTNRVQLDWSYPLAATSYKIYRGPDPYGPFIYLGSTATTSWSQVVPGPHFFYRVTAVLP